MTGLEQVVGIAPHSGSNVWKLSGYKEPEIGKASGKSGIRFVVIDDNGNLKETALITAMSILRVCLTAEVKYGTIQGCTLRFTCAGEGMARTYTAVTCEKEDTKIPTK
jgi:hypothetical protein